MLGLHWHTRPTGVHCGSPVVSCVPAQLVVDVTLQSPLRSTGEPHPNAADVNGAVLQQGRRDTETTYPELVRSGRCCLVVLAMETGGRWSEETVSVIHQLAIARAREVPSYMSHMGETLDSHVRHYMRNLIRRLVGGALLAL